LSDLSVFSNAARRDPEGFRRLWNQRRRHGPGILEGSNARTQHSAYVVKLICQDLDRRRQSEMAEAFHGLRGATELEKIDARLPSYKSIRFRQYVKRERAAGREP